MSYVSIQQSDEGSDDLDVEALGFDASDEFDGRTPLDKSIDRIGMGSYQWTLLCLCGFGWMADNMWIQAVAIILPRVQQHFSVRDSYIGTLSSSMFAGMMFGAVGWGTCSDLMGRTTAFNATLFLTSVFGVFASLAGTFGWLCFALFCLGSAVGGSMPTDGTLLLEHMPNGKQYLVTALSVFFSFGAVFAAVVGLLVIPSRSCPPSPAPCDVATQDMGWKYLLVVLGLVTLSMFIARIVFFKLHESPRYLVHAGRHEEAAEALQMISKYNGSEHQFAVEDVTDSIAPAPPSVPERTAGDTSGSTPKVSPARADGLSESSTESASYQSMGEQNVSLDAHRFDTPAIPHEPRPTVFSVFDADAAEAQLSQSVLPEPQPQEPTQSALRSERPRLVGSRRRSMHRRASTASEYIEAKTGPVCRVLPRWARRPLLAWVDRVAMVLSPEWLRTTLLVWVAWCGMSLAYTMFNVYLPKLLEARSPGGTGDAPKTLEDSLWDVVIYSIGGCPGAVLGAWLIDSPLGRRWSLAGSTFLTAIFCWVFVLVEHPWAVRASTVGISLSATAMWAVLYGWTPEIFGTKVRGTACGIASALSRIGGMIAPILGGSLLMVNHSFPVYASIVIFILSGACVLLLHEHEGQRGSAPGLAH